MQNSVGDQRSHDENWRLFVAPLYVVLTVDNNSAERNAYAAFVTYKGVFFRGEGSKGRRRRGIEDITTVRGRSALFERQQAKTPQLRSVISM